MILPLGDDNSNVTRTPVVNWLLIAVNLVVFIFLQGAGSNEKFTLAYATVPEEIVTGHDVQTPDRVVRDPDTGERVRVPGLQPTPVPVYLTLLISMFMHGSWMHVLGNMLYLWIFGDNVESALGRLRYLAFYLVCGLIASLSQIFMTYASGGNMDIPSLGASGAIAGVLGGYILMFPRQRVRVLIIRILTDVPAWLAIGFWFVLQLISGAGTLHRQGGGVAYAAHVGGFLAGMILVKVFAAGNGVERRRTAW